MSATAITAASVVPTTKKTPIGQQQPAPKLGADRLTLSGSERPYTKEEGQKAVREADLQAALNTIGNGIWIASAGFAGITFASLALGALTSPAWVPWAIGVLLIGVPIGMTLAWSTSNHQGAIF